MKKIMFITNRLPFPNTDGRKNILLQYIRQMKEIWPDSELVNLSFVDDDSYLPHRPAEIDRLIRLELPGAAEKLFNVAWHSLLMRRWPLQVAVYYSRRTHRQIKAVVEAERPDIIFYDMVRVAEYLAPGQGRHILSYDDLLSLRYRRQLEWFRYIPSVLGGFASKLPGRWRRLADAKFIQRRLIDLESRLLDKYERRVASQFHHLVFTSPTEARQFRELTAHESCYGIPMKFDPDLQWRKDGRRYDANKLVYVGKMDIPHNSSAVVYFCERIWPAIKRQAPDATFYIVGKNPVAEVLRLQEACPDVVVTGEVDNVRRMVDDAALMVAPMLFGTGIKTKIIEAMAWGVPVVTNPVGSEGIDASDGEELFVCRTDEEMVRSALLLLGDREMNERMSRSAVRYVASRFSSSATRRNMELILS